MAAPLQSLVELAAEVRERLASGAAPEAFRVVADWYGRARRSDAADVLPRVAVAPIPTGDPRWDAMLAGLTEQLCVDRNLACPRWVFAPERYLPTWWFMTPYRSLHPSAFVEAPIALANRGVFIHKVDFESV